MGISKEKEIDACLIHMRTIQGYLAGDYDLDYIELHNAEATLAVLSHYLSLRVRTPHE